MKLRKTRSRSARSSARKTRRQRKSQRKSQRRSLQRGGGIADDNRAIPADAYVTEQIDPSSTPVLVQKSDIKETI